MKCTRKPLPVCAMETLEFRTLLSGTLTEVAPIEGTGNNVDNPELGGPHTELLRLTTAEYNDLLSEPTGADRPSAREVSNAVAAADESILNDRQLTDLLWI